MSRTATKPRPKPARQFLREDVHLSSKAERVDRDAGIIYGVKVLGLHSQNGRRYLADAVKKAAHLYEGVSVRINHPKKPDDPRDTNDVLGQLHRPRIGPDGCLYADLHYLKSHPMSERLCEAAERMDNVFGFSHNAQGDGEQQNGEFVVREIVEVRSVDLVADPATTTGLFEQREKQPMKLKAFFEAVKQGKPKDGGLDKAKLLKLLEMDQGEYMDGDMDVPGDLVSKDSEPAAVDPDEALWQGFRAAMLAVIDSEGDAASKLKKLGEMLKAHEKLSTPDSQASVGEEEDKKDGDGKDGKDGKDGDGKDGDGKDGDKKVTEGAACADGEKEKYKEEIRFLKAEKAARELCEAKNVKPSPALLKALTALPDEKDRKALLESITPIDPNGNRNKPRTQIPGSGNGRAGSAGTVDDFVKALKTRN